MLSELRKFSVGMVLAHQYIHQLETDIRHAVLGNAGTLISFRIGAEDAGFIAHEFEPVFDRTDLVNLPNYNHLLKAYDRWCAIKTIQCSNFISRHIF